MVLPVRPCETTEIPKSNIKMRALENFGAPIVANSCICGVTEVNREGQLGFFLIQLSHWKSSMTQLLSGFKLKVKLAFFRIVQVQDDISMKADLLTPHARTIRSSQLFGYNGTPS